MTAKDLIEKCDEDYYRVHVTSYTPNVQLDELKEKFEQLKIENHSIYCHMCNITKTDWAKYRTSIADRYKDASDIIDHLIDEHIYLVETINKISEERDIFIDEFFSMNGFIKDKKETK